jgi:hypothetical protein
MPLAGDGDNDLIEVPLVTAAGRSTTDAFGEIRPNFSPHCRIVSL